MHMLTHKDEYNVVYSTSALIMKEGCKNTNCMHDAWIYVVRMYIQMQIKR